MLNQCESLPCESSEPIENKISDSARELELIARYEGQCVAATVKGEIVKGAVVEVRYGKGVILMDFVGGYCIQCLEKDLKVAITTREDVEAHLSCVDDEEGDSILTEEFLKRVAQLLN